MAFSGNFMCTSFKKELLEGGHNFTNGGDVFKIALYDSNASFDDTTTDYTATSDNNVQYLETRTATSFAAADDGETENTISATFAQASSPDAATPATEEHTQEQDIVYTAEVSNNNGMGLG